MAVTFKDNRIEVETKLKDLAQNTLEECAGEMESQVKRNTKRKTTQTQGSWRHIVTEEGDDTVAVIGSSYWNAIYEEFGTGEYALEGRGRKGYWVYIDDGRELSPPKGTGKSYTLAEAKRVVAILRSKNLNAYYTDGKKARRPFHKAYTALKNKLIKHIQDVFKGAF